MLERNVGRSLKHLRSVGVDTSNAPLKIILSQFVHVSSSRFFFSSFSTLSLLLVSSHLAGATTAADTATHLTFLLASLVDGVKIGLREARHIGFGVLRPFSSSCSFFCQKLSGYSLCGKKPPTPKRRENAKTTLREGNWQQHPKEEWHPY